MSDGEACLIFSQKGAVLYAMLEEVGVDLKVAARENQRVPFEAIDRFWELAVELASLELEKYSIPIQPVNMISSSSSSSNSSNRKRKKKKKQ